MPSTKKIAKTCFHSSSDVLISPCNLTIFFWKKKCSISETVGTPRIYQKFLDTITKLFLFNITIIKIKESLDSHLNLWIHQRISLQRTLFQMTFCACHCQDTSKDQQSFRCAGCSIPPKRLNHLSTKLNFSYFDRFLFT